MGQHAVEFVAVSKEYGKSKVLNDINLSIEVGKLVTLIGPSGCGKTTTMKMVNRLIEPTSGKVLVSGEDVSQLDPVELRRNIGYVIQQIGLFPHMTIEENISLVPRLQGKEKVQYAKRVEELLNLIGLDPAKFRTRYPKELSGGQQQRIGVARALAANPSLILMDEPFSALDPISREQLQDELVTLQAALHKTIVFVTHDMDEALKIADEIVLMKDGELIQSGPPDKILRHPKNDFVREFVGEKRFRPQFVANVAAQTMAPAVTVRPSRGLAECIHLMRKHRVNALVVTDQSNKYLGIIGMEQIYDHFRDEAKVVSDVMRKSSTIIQADTPMPKVLSVLASSEYGFLPVLDEKDSLLGVITRASVIAVLSSAIQGGEDDDRVVANRRTELA